MFDRVQAGRFAGPVKLIVAANDLRAREIFDNFRLFDRDVILCPARDFIFFQADVSSKQLDRERVRMLQALAQEPR